MLKLSDLYFLVQKNLLEKKKRAFLTISGIIIGIFTFTFFIFVSQGLSNAISEQFSGLGVNVLVVQKAGGAGGPPTSSSGLTQTHISKIKQVVRGYTYITPQLFYSGLYEYAREKAIITTLSVPDENLDVFMNDLAIEIEFGRNIRSGDKGVAVIGAKTAKDAFKNKEVALGSNIKINGSSFRVIGIIKERGDLFVDGSMFINYNDLEKLSDNDGTFSAIRVGLLETTDPELVEEKILTKLNPNGKQKEVSVTSPKQAMEQFDQIIGVLNLIIGFVSSIALFVGGINVMNTMYSNIVERINEISVMKALGATSSDIRNLFLAESAFLGLIGATIGFLLSYLLAEFLGAALVQLGYNVPIYFEVEFFITVILVTAFLTMLFGTYPAIKAANVNPADNLRDE